VQQRVQNTGDITMSDRTTDSYVQPEGNHCDGQQFN